MEIYNFTSKARHRCGSQTALPVKVIEMQVLGPLSWLLNQKLGLEVGPVTGISTNPPGILMHAQSREPLLWSSQAFSVFSFCKHFFQILRRESRIGCYQEVSIPDAIIYSKEKWWVEPGELCEQRDLCELLHPPLVTGPGVMTDVIYDDNTMN